jgi:hypothetical protein
MDRQAPFEHAIGSLYDAAAEPERWPEALTGGADLLGALGSQLSPVNRTRRATKARSTSWPGAGGQPVGRLSPGRRRWLRQGQHLGPLAHEVRGPRHAGTVVPLLAGHAYSEAVLTVRRAGEEPFEFLVITMTKVIVASVSIGGSEGDSNGTENVTLRFAEVEMRDTQQTEDGTEGLSKTYSYRRQPGRPHHLIDGPVTLED